MLYTRTVKMRSDSSKKGGVHALVFFPIIQITAFSTEKNLFIRCQAKNSLGYVWPRKGSSKQCNRKMIDYFCLNKNYSDNVLVVDIIPKSILARGKTALAAYRRALKKGKTYDKRVKVLLIGQDRAGKTSVARALRGEAFDEDEPSTDGVKMDEPLKNATEKEPWGYSRRKSSAFEDKCVRIMHQDLLEEVQNITGNSAAPPVITNQLNGKGKGKGLSQLAVFTNDFLKTLQL